MDHVEKEIKIADIVTRLVLREKISENEERRLKEWLGESVEHQKWLREYRERLPYREFKEIVEISNSREQWQRLERLVKRQRYTGWRKWGAYAAGVALLISMGVWLGLQQEEAEVSVTKMAVIEPGTTQALLILDNGQKITLTNQDTLVNTVSSNINVQTGFVRYDVKDVERSVVEYNTIEVPRGGIYSLELSDGTKVFLNSDSRLKYPVIFSDECREVELIGEAFFEVSPDSLHPFIVHTKDVETRVLGTSFNIQAYPDEPEIQTTLFSGRVQVSVNDLPLREVLEPGMQASWLKGADEICLKKVNMEIHSLWRDGIIMLDDDELESVMRMLSRWYNVIYEFKGDASIKHTFTGKINRNEDLESVLRTLTLLGGPKFEIEGTVVYVY